MQFLFDKLSASIVGGIVFMMLVSLQVRVHSNTIEDTLSYRAKKETLSFAETLERDIANAGYLTVPGQLAITGHTNTPVDSSVVTTFFEFWGVDAAGNRAQIRYVTSPADSAIVDDKVIPTYSLERLENDGAGWRIAGGSMNSITEFSIDLLDNNSTATTKEEARRVRIRLVNAIGVLPGSKASKPRASRSLGQLRWGITLSPRGLSQQQYQG